MSAKGLNGSEHFLRMLESGVRKIMRDPAAPPELRLGAINAGAKLLAIRHKITGSDEKGYFD